MRYVCCRMTGRLTDQINNILDVHWQREHSRTHGFSIPFLTDDYFKLQRSYYFIFVGYLRFKNNTLALKKLPCNAQDDSKWYKLTVRTICYGPGNQTDEHSLNVPRKKSKYKIINILTKGEILIRKIQSIPVKKQQNVKYQQKVGEKKGLIFCLSILLKV